MGMRTPFHVLLATTQYLIPQKSNTVMKSLQYLIQCSGTNRKFMRPAEVLHYIIIPRSTWNHGDAAPIVAAIFISPLKDAG